MRIRLIESLRGIEPSAWDALTGDDDPFVEHAFLSVLEESATIGPGTGWEAMHVTAWQGDELVGALPLYVKDHSYGEYIFDWAWADAAARLGVPYYPKLVSMVPVTPATGRRFLIAPEADPEAVTRALLDGAFEALEVVGGSSIHLLFLSPEESERVRADPRFMRRLTQQYHWKNDGYGDFDDFLGRFRSSMRKKLRRERRVVAETGLVVRQVEGKDLDASEWAMLRSFYRDTCARKGSHPYLAAEFFDLAQERLAHRTVVAMAYDGKRPVAASLNFEKGAHLYGRYWGCSADHDMLHFELCYYQLIERAIQKGMRRFEAGAQGSHKLRRGLLPTGIHSAHHIVNPVLARAVGDYLPREAMSVQRQMLELAEHGPFRRDT